MDAKDKEWIQRYMELLLPPRTFEYFEWIDMEVKEGAEKYKGLYGFDDEYTLVLQEKDKVPEEIKELSTGKQLRTKGYSEISMMDFPIRGRKTKLIYRIRKWQIEGDKKIYQGKYEITQAGVKYSKEFSFFFES